MNNPTGVLFTSGSYYATMDNSTTVVQQNALGTPSAGDVISLYFDIPNRKFYMARNGTYIAGHNPVAGTGGIDITTGDLRIYLDTYTFTGANLNMGQKDYAYPVAGYGALKEPAKSDLKRCKFLPSGDRPSFLYDRGLKAGNSSAAWLHAYSNFVLSTGLIYAEMNLDSGNVSHDMAFGPVGHEFVTTGQNYGADTAFLGHSLYQGGADIFTYDLTGDAVATGGGTSQTVLKFAINFSTLKFWRGYGSAWIGGGDPALGTGGTSFVAGDWRFYDSGFSSQNTWNFGDSPWSQTPPTGFVGPATLDFDTLRPSSSVQMQNTTGSSCTITNNGLTVAHTPASYHSTTTQYAMLEGKYYARMICTDVSQLMFGVGGPLARGDIDFYTQLDQTAVHMSDGRTTHKYVLGVHSANVYPQITNGGIVGIAVDATTRKIWFEFDGVWANGDPVAGTGGDTLPSTGLLWFLHSAYTNNGVTLDFTTTGPTGYQLLNAQTAYQPELEYGPNGCQLLFEDSSNLGLVTAGNKVPWALTGITSDDQLTDTPGDPYAVISTLAGLDGVISNGGMTLQSTSNSFKNHRLSLPLMEEGTYLEFRRDGAGGDGRLTKYTQGYTLPLSATGVAIPGYSSATYDDWSYSFNTGETRRANVAVPGPSGIASGQWGAMAYKNGRYYIGTITGSTITWFNSGDPVAETGALMEGFTGPQFVGLGVYNGVSNTATINCGQLPFQATPPTGFKELKLSNKPTPKYHGRDKFDVQLRIGDATEHKVYTPFGKIGLYWGKSRSSAQVHQLYDQVRGATKALRSDTTAAEATVLQGLKSFDAGGVTLGTDGNPNGSGTTYVDWLFGNDGTEVTNNDGTIPSQVLADSSGYMSVATATGTGVSGTFGHGLDNVELSINKSRNNVGSSRWNVWHKYLSSTTHYLYLDSSVGQANSSPHFSGVWGTLVGCNTTFLTNGAEIISYNFQSVPGLCKVTTYKGTGSVNGPFIPLDFLARWVLIKRRDSSGAWEMHDTARDSNGNPIREELNADTSAAETLAGGDRLDITAQGITIRSTGAALNANGGTYLIMAIADSAGGGNLPAVLGN